jgi:DNA (cytosine-5)-methyltransferase 1
MVWERVEHIFCDTDPFCKAVLKKHWPDAKIYGDIRTLTADADRSGGQTRADEKETKRRPQSAQFVSVRRNKFDLLTGGFPCQPFSQAGRRRGTEDDRYLWPEMLRVIREFHPRWVIGENVGGFLTWDNGLVFDQVLSDLEDTGYSPQAFVIPACAVNAPHRRDRVWIVARADTSTGGWGQRSPKSDRLRKGESAVGQEKRRRPSHENRNASDPFSARLQRRGTKRVGYDAQFDRTRSDERFDWHQNWTEIAAKLCTVDDGLPSGLVRPRGWRNAALKGAGNSIVPQVAAEIMRAIKAADPLLQ